MVKRKQRGLIEKSESKNDTTSMLIDSSSFKTGMDLSREDSWIVVTKQRITILIPPLPAAKQYPIPKQESNPPQGTRITTTTTTNRQSQLPTDTNPSRHSIDERENKLQPTLERAKPPSPPPPPPPRLDFAMGSEIPVRVESFQIPKKLGDLRILNKSRIFDSSLDRFLLLDQKLRACNLERKIQRAGGLSRWLASLGLGQFVKIFQRKRVNKFQLVNMSMKKLKDMGADAVGPRRKLMHAIESLSQPYCFKST